jgi:hypothetical protein
MSYCGRCGKWNGAIAVPAGTEPTWCICPKDLAPIVSIMGQQIAMLEEQLNKAQESLNEVNRAGAANSWDAIAQFRDEYLTNDPIYEKVRAERAANSNFGAASNMIAYIKELRNIINELKHD